MANANLFLFADNVSTLAASSIASTDTTIAVSTGTGSLFPTVSSGEQLAVTIEDVSGNIEVVYCTGVTGDTLTVVRAQEGTSAQNFASGSYVEMRVTSGVLASFLQKEGGDTLTNTTTLAGVLQLNSNGSIQGGEYAGGAVRGGPGETDNELVVPSGGGAPTIGGSDILTEANVASTLPTGYGLVVSGMVLMWTGASNAIPSGYVLCDGTNSTPDLRDSFVVGAGDTFSEGDTGGTAWASFGTTGSTSLSALSIGATTLTTLQIPSHTHTMWTGGYAGAGGGSATVTLLNDGVQATNFPAGASGISGNQIIGSAGGGGSHTHSISGSTAHTHSYTSPPYTALFYIMKT